MAEIQWYFYLHTNGNVIGKNPVVIDADNEYFNSPFVRKVWAIKNIEDFKQCIIEARKMGANPEKLELLQKEQNITIEHSEEPRA